MSCSEVLTNFFYPHYKYFGILRKIRHLLAFLWREEAFTYIANKIAHFGALTQLGSLSFERHEVACFAQSCR